MGRLTIYTSNGQEIGPFGYNGDPATFEEQLAFLATCENLVFTKSSTKIGQPNYKRNPAIDAFDITINSLSEVKLESAFTVLSSLSKIHHCIS